EYRDRTGQPLSPTTDLAIEKEDQRQARAAYPTGGVLGILDVTQLLGTALHAITTARTADDLRNPLPDFAARSFSGGRVPLRDLADHAPINYVSIFTGRIP